MIFLFYEIHKDSHLPSALLSLLSVQHQQRSLAAAFVPPCIQVTDMMKPKEMLFPPTLPKLPIDSLDVIPENIKAHLLQQAFMQNNNSLGQKDEHDSEAELDDTDDIALPEEADYYESNAFANASGASDVADANDRRRDGHSSDDASRQFECRHCGKRYRWKSTLRRHENVECGGKAPAHQCPYCSYKAKQRGNLGVHIRKHHNTEWYVYASNKVRRNKKTAV
ncbi:unnamed protein product [Leptosia nina]|uniref:C2H2-type domain-containing protein n=1 Tax=Leptosia nina TaxID=320188 RepID=A0AAV1JS36_9NEOP